ncbi:hypothetical protein NM688_g5938 [Phlebia brevispora]|uniref:Uncharacterized protein n=1 Tax=Phlebia brevispora TaxID=194682 RepID=A0ACC1SMJ1_9APHY|nr:hypothetical protein NM688_g5938 [Phlebia brevispora]
MSQDSASQEVSDRLQAVQVTPRSKTITSSASNMASSSDHAASRVALRNELAGRQCFDDQSVLQRLGTERVTDAFVDACYLDFTRDSTHYDHFETLREIVSQGERGGGKRETQMYESLLHILSYIADYEWNDMKGRGDGPRHASHSSQHNLTPEVHTLGFPRYQPDLSIVDPGTPFVPSGPRGELRYSSHWRYRAAFVEVKPTSAQGPTSRKGETVQEIVQQAADYARLHMAARPFQLFSVCLLIYGLKFCVAIFDRDGVVFSPEGDLATRDGWNSFVRIARCLAVTMTDEELGRDPTAQLLASSDPTTLRLQKEARLLGLAVPDNFLSVSLGDSTGRRWATVAMIWSSLSLIGRGTTVWVVKELHNGKPEGAVRVMKTAWRSSRRTPEASIYKALQDAQKFRSHDCVAQLDVGDDVRSQDRRIISVSTLRASEDRSPDESREDKILHRLLLSPVGRPIWEYESEEILIRGIKAAIEGHKYLYENGILHRDVSAGNVLLAQHPQPGMEGFITDLDYARVGETSRVAEQAKAAGKSVPHGGHITGTYQFMSIRILRLMWLDKIDQNPSEIVNEVRDDLESFVWVFCYALMRHHVSYHPKDAMAEELFRDAYGRLNLDAIHDSRASLKPILTMRSFGNSLSVQLFQWFRQQLRLLMRPPLYDGETGFEFTYETLVAWLDTALAAVTKA